MNVPVLALMLLTSLAATSLGQQERTNSQAIQPVPTDSNAKSGDQTKTNKTLEFPVQGNSIDAEEFYKSVLSQLHWTTDLTEKVGTELQQASPLPQLEPVGRISLEALGVLTSLFPSAFELVKDANQPSQDSTLRVNVNELESKWSEQKLSLRKWLSTKSRQPLFEVCGKVGFDGRSERNHIVVVLPGLHGGDLSACEFAAAINKRTGLAACAFRYPNDAPLEESSDYLLQVIQQWHAQQPNRKISLVTHSMGGLVARNAVERQLANDPNCLGLERLVLICPPNQGSIFAEYAGVLEGAEQLQRILNRTSGRRLFSAILDGFNEAPSDLVPGSPLLAKLNEAQRHPGVQYTILAGDAGLIDPLISQVGNELLEALASRARGLKPLQDRASNLLNSEELQKGTGDGVVTVESAKLLGVNDFEILPINHLEWCELEKPAGKRVLDEVVERLEKRSRSF